MQFFQPVVLYQRHKRLGNMNWHIFKAILDGLTYGQFSRANVDLKHVKGTYFEAST